MIEFIFKFLVGSGLFIGFYQAVLQREKMFMFNRFYLLVTLVLSLVLPFIPLEWVNFSVTDMAGFENRAAYTPISVFSYWANFIWLIFGIVSCFYMLRFIINLVKIGKYIDKNEKICKSTFTIVKVKDIISPFSFFRYIVVSENQLVNGRLQPEIFIHEYTHVKQKHTLDIIFLELITIFFWYNPFLSLYRKYITANHEYLADEAVLKKDYVEVASYQHLLLNTIALKTENPLAHSFYHNTKRRLLMMTKNTSKLKTTVLKILSIPVIAAVIFLLGGKVSTNNKDNNTTPTDTIVEPSSTNENKKQESNWESDGW